MPKSGLLDTTNIAGSTQHGQQHSTGHDNSTGSPGGGQQTTAQPTEQPAPAAPAPPANPANPGGGGGNPVPHVPAPTLPHLPSTSVAPVDQVLTQVQAVAQCTLEGYVDNPLRTDDPFDQCVYKYTHG